MEKMNKLLEQLKKIKRPRSLNERYQSMLQRHRSENSENRSEKNKEEAEGTSEANQSTGRLDPYANPVPSTSKAAQLEDEADSSSKPRQKRKLKTFPYHHNLHNIADNQEAPNIFPSEPSGETIYNNKEFELIVQEKTLKNSSVFDISNHVCSIKVVKKNKRRTLLTDVTMILQNELTKIVTRIQSEYPDKDYRRQIYVTIVDKPNISTGINTRNYSLHEDASKIASASIRHLENFLVSHQNMSLDNAFHIDIKTLGLSNVQHRVIKKGNLRVHVPEHEKYTSDSDSSESIDDSGPAQNPGTKVKTGYTTDPYSKERWKFHIPSGYNEKKNAFVNYCLIIATIIAVYYQRQLPIIEPFKKTDFLLHSEYKKKWKVICEINSVHQKKKYFSWKRTYEDFISSVKEN